MPLPAGNPGLERRALIRVGFEEHPQPCACRVAERSQHAGDVAQRRLRHAPLGDRPRRLALEIDEEDVAVDLEHLSEMEVAVRANAFARFVGGQHRLD